LTGERLDRRLREAGGLAEKTLPQDPHEVLAMSTTPPPGSQSGPTSSDFGRRIEEAMELIEMELRHAISYVNDAVVPQVRRESISAMRSVADTLRNLADRFEEKRGPGTPPKGPQS
jgi:hypothetical protein